jgi:hypothetical protein
LKPFETLRFFFFQDFPLELSKMPLCEKSQPTLGNSHDNDKQSSRRTPEKISNPVQKRSHFKSNSASIESIPITTTELIMPNANGEERANGVLAEMSKVETVSHTQQYGTSYRIRK